MTTYNPAEVDRLIAEARGEFLSDDSIDAMADQLEAANAEIERLRRDYLSIADALLPESSGPQDLIAEARRLRKIARDVRNDEIHSFCVD